MLKENLYNLIITLFFGFLFVYIMHKPKTVIVKNPNLNKIKLEIGEENSEEKNNII